MFLREGWTPPMKTAARTAASLDHGGSLSPPCGVVSGTAKSSGRGAATNLPLHFEMLLTSSLRSDPRNARTHSKKQIRQIADSIARFGFINPIIADDRGRIVAGFARAEAAKLLGEEYVPVA